MSAPATDGKNNVGSSYSFCQGSCDRLNVGFVFLLAMVPARVALVTAPSKVVAMGCAGIWHRSCNGSCVSLNSCDSSEVGICIGPFDSFSTVLATTFAKVLATCQR